MSSPQPQAVEPDGPKPAAPAWLAVTVAFAAFAVALVGGLGPLPLVLLVVCLVLGGRYGSAIGACFGVISAALVFEWWLAKGTVTDIAWVTVAMLASVGLGAGLGWLAESRDSPHEDAPAPPMPPASQVTPPRVAA
jgi:hypothetical protein